MTTYEIWKQNQKTGDVEILNKGISKRKKAENIFDFTETTKDSKIKLIVRTSNNLYSIKIK